MPNMHLMRNYTQWPINVERVFFGRGIFMKFCKKSEKLLGLFSEMFQKNFQVIGFTAQLGKHKLNNKGNHNALRLDVPI